MEVVPSVALVITKRKPALKALAKSTRWKSETSNLARASILQFWNSRHVWQQYDSSDHEEKTLKLPSLIKIRV